MTQISFLEKIGVLLGTMFSSVFSIFSFIVVLFLGVLFATTNRSNAKESRKIYFLLYFAFILVFVIQYGSVLGSFIDYFMNHVFVQIYFPNLAVYVLALVISNVIMWKTMFKWNDRVLKITNSIFFCMLHYLFILLLGVVSKNELNVFRYASIYQNKQALSLIELSSFVFIAWTFFLGIYVILHKLLHVKENIVLDEAPEKVVEQEVLESPIVAVDAPLIVYSDQKKRESKNDDVCEKDLYEGMLTLEDYKLLLELLKEQRHKEKITKNELEEVMNFGSPISFHQRTR